MHLRYLFAGLALSAALLVTGCSSCHHRGCATPAVAAAPPCNSCGAGVPPGTVVPPPPAPVGGVPPGAFGTSASGGPIR
jgi:hypothetical protein